MSRQRHKSSLKIEKKWRNIEFPGSKAWVHLRGATSVKSISILFFMRIYFFKINTVKLSEVKQRRRTPQHSWRGMQGAAAHQHRFPVFNTRSQAVLDFMNSMSYNRRIFSFKGYCFQQPCICFMFIPAAELRGIQINKLI
jgi:hypothetical protein